MNLANALRLNGGETVAFVGAGGKTGAMFSLAQSLILPVVLTTTTHLGVWQAGLADVHCIVCSPNDIQEIDFNKPKILLLTGPANSDDRLVGLDDEALNALHSICKQRNITLLIEADGARQRPLKAPAAYEPVIPEWVDHVVVMAGLSGLGKPLDAKTVHRPEVFSEIASLPLGDLVRVSDLIDVLASPLGGQKHIPAGDHKTLFLNQAEGALLAAKGGRIAQSLLDAFDAVLVGSLHEPGQEGPVFSAHSQIAGIILAAGGSERLGRPKQLLNWQGKPFITRVVQNALNAGLSPLFVITGAERNQVEAAVSGMPVHLVHNPDWAAGQSTSLNQGLSVLPERCEGAMFLLSDQPQISPVFIRALIEHHAETRAPIIAPISDSKHGNPVLFDRETFQALSAIEGDKGGRAVFSQFDVNWLAWVDSRILMDVDIEADLSVLNEAYFNFS